MVTMELGSALLATLRYWRECGIDRLSGEDYGWGGANPFIRMPARQYPSQRVLSSPPVVQVPQTPSEPTVAVEPPPVVSLDRLLTPVVPLSERAPLFQQWSDQVAQCRACPLSVTRQQTVYGSGAKDATAVWIADAPSALDEQTRQPLGGETRELVTGMIRAAGWQRDQVYVTYVVKCRPPGDRNPKSDEIRLCQTYWIQELETIRPRIIVALGKVAVETLLGPVGQLATIRGQLHSWRGIPVIPLYHPAYCLRTPLAKRAVWEDLIKLIKFMHNQGFC
ncbi:MAG: uracil-DNA glycosylase [Magnetococcales bacterium]|nr:uracil-DNA glycosylase [Magnetococcales bacterium]